jgi:COP9 signalosome complex subunit 2
VRLLSYTKAAVTRNASEKSINSILDYVSAAQDMVFMEKVYSVTLDNLQEQKNDRLWTKTNLKLAKVINGLHATG